MRSGEPRQLRVLFGTIRGQFGNSFSSEGASGPFMLSRGPDENRGPSAPKGGPLTQGPRKLVCPPSHTHSKIPSAATAQCPWLINDHLGWPVPSDFSSPFSSLAVAQPELWRRGEMSHEKDPWLSGPAPKK